MADQPASRRARPRSVADHAALRRLGENVRRLREERELTIEDFAGLIDVHPTHVYKIQRGEISSGVVVLLRISRALGVTLSELVDGVE